MFTSVLLPIDLNQESSWDRALPAAEQIARDYGAKLTIMSVLPTFGLPAVSQYFPEGFEKKAEGAASEALKSFVRDKCTNPDQVKLHLAHGTIYDEILQYAAKIQCDLIVMGSHRPEFKDYLLGPNAARVVRHAKQSVFVVRPT
ncbi:universal stress protein [Maritalea porphyrae]|uniref:universal stress protein n=1 Tax=Maritalea porphyrae TaxID=880732 RepID=UPI0022B072DC|nr:universal stress protein [Maritalea porphyrae]MCZ4272508.1 universal stress protein [Maritalea porphyrae]